MATDTINQAEVLEAIRKVAGANKMSIQQWLQQRLADLQANEQEHTKDLYTRFTLEPNEEPADYPEEEMEERKRWLQHPSVRSWIIGKHYRNMNYEDRLAFDQLSGALSYGESDEEMKEAYVEHLMRKHG